MKELVIVSGKGGTGKTSLTAAFSSLAGRHILCDADVDAADLHLLLAPEVSERHEFMGRRRRRSLTPNAAVVAASAATSAALRP